MNKLQNRFFLIPLIILLIPTAFGRLIIDLAGGLLILFLLLPIVLSILGWLGWKYLENQTKTCKECGVTYFSNNNCPSCGSYETIENKLNTNENNRSENIPASSAVIDINAEEAD